MTTTNTPKTIETANTDLEQRIAELEQTIGQLEARIEKAEERILYHEYCIEVGGHLI